MATRNRDKWNLSSLGYFDRQIGWNISGSGKLYQHKFLLGTDLREAQKRERRLRDLWDQYERSELTRRTSDEYRPPQRKAFWKSHDQSVQFAKVLWAPELLEIAKKIAKGETSFIVSRRADETVDGYTDRVGRMQSEYPMVNFIPGDSEAIRSGTVILDLVDNIAERFKSAPIEIPPVDPEKMRISMEADRLLDSIGLGPNASLAAYTAAKQVQVDKLLQEPSSQKPRVTNTSPPVPDRAARLTQNIVKGTLHEAFNAFITWIEKEYYRSDLNRIGDWGLQQRRDVRSLIAHHRDMPLATLDYDGVDDMIGYWRRRPLRRNSTKAVAIKSASNFISVLTRFFNWLHLSKQFNWRRPADFEDIKTKVNRLTSDHSKGLEQVKTFSRDEVILLLRYSLPMERLLVLLGLNCGFGIAEIASLTIGEVCLFKGHSERHQEILAYKTTDADSFIKRIRRKNGVYGEHILYPATVQSLQWALEERKKHPDFAPEQRLILSENGVAFDSPTVAGHRCQKIPNYFGRLLQRIRKDGHEISNLSFNKLRKTSGDLIRRFASAEIMAVFHSRGQAERTDDLSDRYSNRPFGKVFTAIKEVEKYLGPAITRSS